MFRIDVATAAGVIPTPAAAGTPGYFTNGNPATSTPSTVVDADFLNMVQEELMAIVVAASITPSKTTRNQVLTAINALIAGATGAGAIQAQAGNYAAAGGTANAITATFTPAVAAHVTGMPLRVKIASNNTAAATLNPGPGVKSITSPLGAALKANDLRAGAIAEFVYDGTNYQLTGVYYPTGSITTIGGNTTVTTADFGVVFRASGLAADATLSLPALAGVPDGFEFTVWNDTKASPSGTAFKVIIDPNSTEQLDGLTTRDVWEQVRVTVIKENGMWRTKAGAYRYYSGEQTMTLSGALALTHGLGVRPARVWYELRCTAADGNFVTDDIIATNGFGAGYDSGSNWDGWTTYSDGTTINIRFGNTTVGKFANKSAATQLGLTAANWKMRVFAEA